MRRNHLTYLFKHSAIYGLGEMLNKAFGFILIPVYTRYLTTSDYGVLQLLLISASLYATVLQMGLGSAILKLILHQDDVDRNKAYTTAFVFVVLVSGALAFPIFYLPEALSDLLTGSAKHTGLVQILAISIVLRNFTILPIAKLRIESRSFQFSMLNSFKFLLQLLLTLFFVVYREAGIAGIVWAEMLSSLVFAAVFTGVILPNLRFTFSWSILREMLLYGLPLVPAGLAMFALNMSDRYFLRFYATLEDVGVYSLGYRLGMVMALLVGAFQQAWGTVLFQIAKEADAKQVFARNFTYFLLCLCLAGLVVSLFAREILAVMATEKFVSSYKIVPLVAFSYVFYGIYYYTSAGLNIVKKTRYQPIVVGAAAALNMALNYLLIPRFGPAGAAWATLVSFAVMAGYVTRIAQRFYPISFEKKRVAVIFILVACAIVANTLLTTSHAPPTFILKIVLVLSLPALLLVFGFFDNHELSRITSFAARVRSNK